MSIVSTLKCFLDIPLTQSKLIQLTELRGVAKAIPKKKSDFVLFNGDIMTTATLLSCFCFTLGVVFAFAACPIDWSEFQGECLHFSRASRGWIDAAVSKDHAQIIKLNQRT